MTRHAVIFLVSFFNLLTSLLYSLVSYSVVSSAEAPARKTITVQLPMENFFYQEVT